MPSSSVTKTPTAASPAADEPRQRGPLGEHLTDAELLPIRVHTEDGCCWQVDYGSYVQGYHDSREEAIVEALAAAVWENRELTIERPRRISETDLRTEVDEVRGVLERLELLIVMGQQTDPAVPVYIRSITERLDAGLGLDADTESQLTRLVEILGDTEVV